MSYEIIEQWKRIGLLNGLTEQQEEPCAFLLENQRLYNLDDEMSPQFRRVSIPLLRRVFESLSKQANVSCVLAEPFPRFLVTNVELDINVENLSGMEILDAETDAVAQIAADLTEELAGFIKSKKAKQFYLEGLGLEDNKFVVFYEI